METKTTGREGVPKILVEDMPLWKGIRTLIGLSLKKRFRGDHQALSKTHYEELIKESIYLVSRLGIKKFSTEYMGNKDPRAAIDALESYLKSKKDFNENNPIVKGVFPKMKNRIKKDGEEEDSKSQVDSYMNHNHLFTVIKCLEDHDYKAVASRFNLSVRKLKETYVEEYCAIMIDLQNMVDTARKEENVKPKPEEESSMTSEKELKTEAFIMSWSFLIACIVLIPFGCTWLVKKIS